MKGNKQATKDAVYMGVHVPRDLVDEARVAAIRERVRFREWVEGAIVQKLRDRPQSGGKKTRGEAGKQADGLHPGRIPY